MVYLNNTTDPQDVYIPRQDRLNVEKTGIDLSMYLTSGETIEIINETVDDEIEERNLVNSAQTQEMIDESLSGYATEEWVESQGYLTEHQSLSAYSTTEEVEDMISAATEGFVDSGDVQTQIDDSLSGYATEEWVENQGYLTEHQSLSAYSTTEQVEGMISAATEDFVTSGEVETQIENALSGLDLSDYYTSAETESAISAATEDMATETWVESQGYLTEHQSLSGLFANAEYVSSAKTINFYDKDNVLVDTIDATDFIKDGMVDNVVISGNTLIISFNTDAGKEDIEIPLTDIFNPANYYTKTDIDNKQYVNSGQVQTQIDAAISGIDLSEYYTSAQTDSAITEAVGNARYIDDVGIGTTTKRLNFYKTIDESHRDVLQYIYYKTINNEDIVSEITGGNISLPTSADVETQITSKNYVTSADTQTQIDDSLSGYSTTDEVEGMISAATEDFVDSGQVQTQIDNAISGIDLSDYYTSAETQSAITESLSGKQDTLVSGTNIKTINNQSLLGSGNIDIQGGGGSGSESVVELTKAQYEALSAYASDTTYVITDADAVDLNDFATSGDVAELSAITEDLSENKADKATVNANNGNRFPYWNADGIITGYNSSVLSTYTMNINGSTRYVANFGNGSWGNMFCPQSEGSAGQLVISNGSGAPSWTSFKFWFGTQDDYDAISTKDSTCIYFITD